MPAQVSDRIITTAISLVIFAECTMNNIGGAKHSTVKIMVSCYLFTVVMEEPAK